MSKTNSHYNYNQMRDALRKCGLNRGDVVLCHSNVGFFGRPEEGETPEALFDLILRAFQDTIGSEGTIVAPTFTYSFCKGEVFDPANTMSQMGIFAEMLRRQPAARRSEEPIFSVAAMGALSRELTENVPQECFGKNSFWDRLLQANGLICFMNLDLDYCTFNHYVERSLNVPYRYDKLFTGYIERNGERKKSAAIHFCRDLSNPGTLQSAKLLTESARKAGLLQSTKVGRGQVVCIRAADIYRLIESGIKRNPWFMTVSAKAKKKPLLMPQPDTDRFDISLSPQASMEEMIQSLWQVPRDIISDGYDAALIELSKQLPMTIHEYPTGTSCWTWIVPEKWTCREASLETVEGKKLFSYAKHPLHVTSYSLPFSGRVSREELFSHLHVHPGNDRLIPFRFAYYERDWGLCCSRRLKDRLTDDYYQVLIDTQFSYSALKVGEIIAQGESDESIVLCCHLCHPSMANDGLSGVVVGMEVMRHLMNRKDLHYTYRLLIVPETIGSVAYLSKNEDLIPKVKGGLFLEMLGGRYPHALQHSFSGDSEVDTCFSLGLREHDRQSIEGEYRTLVLNDERQFNAPGVRIPMLSLIRALPNCAPDFPYLEYHSSGDTAAIISVDSLNDSKELILRMIDIFETNRIPTNNFKGEIFCSRFGINIDSQIDPKASKALLNVIDKIDGTRSTVDIALECGMSFESVRALLDELNSHELVKFIQRS
ncbi:MAG: DUF4910 domain-containing protein [Desulfomonilaceae bacterium]